MDRSKWEYKKLGDICKSINAGGTPSRGNSAYWNGDIPWVKIRDMNSKYVNSTEEFITEEGLNNSSAKLFEPGTILYSIFATIGAASILEIPATTNQAIAGIVLGDGCDRDFYYYYLTSLKNHFENISKGVAQNNINLSVLRNQKVVVPPFADQQRIVAELDCLNEMIAVKQEQLKEFDKLAQSFFYDMFEPIDKYVPASHYIESLGGGKSLAGEEECINKVLKTGAVTYDYFKEDEVKNLPKDYEPLEDHLLRDGDLLVSRMNTLEYVGAIAYVWKAPQNTYLPDRLWRAKLKSGANPIYLWFSLKQEKAKEQIRAKASGTSGSMKNISMPKFLSTTIKEAPLALQQQFAEKISAIEAQKELVKQSIAETQALLDYTMDKYFG